MTELKRQCISGTLDSGSSRTLRWVVSGPSGALALHTINGQFEGVFVHSRTEREGSVWVEKCEVVDLAPCWGDAIAHNHAAPVFDARLTSDVAVYARLEAEYLIQFPGGGRCGESAPQAAGGFADLYACCSAAPTQPHTADCGLYTGGAS